MQFLPRIKARLDAVHQHHDRRRPEHDGAGAAGGAARAVKPEMCSLNMGSMNFGLYPDARSRYQTFKHDVGAAVPRRQPRLHLPQHVQGHRVHPRAPRRGLRHALRVRVLRRRPPLHLAHFLDRKLVEAAALRADDLRHPRRHRRRPREPAAHAARPRDKLFGDDYEWSVLAAGRHQMALATMGALMGGNVRVGLEDSIYLGKGQLATSNAEQVAKIRRILEELSLEIATPDEARERLRAQGRRQRRVLRRLRSPGVDDSFTTPESWPRRPGSWTASTEARGGTRPACSRRPAS